VWVRQDFNPQPTDHEGTATRGDAKYMVYFVDLAVPAFGDQRRTGVLAVGEMLVPFPTHGLVARVPSPEVKLSRTRLAFRP
jgi:hypothetical protein